MEYFNNTLAIEASWLIDQEIISESNFKLLSHRNKINVVRRGCRNTPALVAYDSMPERFKRAVVNKIGDPYKQVKINQLSSFIKYNASISDFFTAHRFDNGKHLSQDTRLEYIANATILEAIHDLIVFKKNRRALLNGKTQRAWEEISDAVQELDKTKYPHNLPANYRRLEEKYKRYFREGMISLIHKNFLNINAAKVNNVVKSSVLCEIISDPRNFDNAQCMRFYNTLAETAGWDKITTSTVAIWRDKLDLVSYAGRRGEVAFSNKKSMMVKRSRPTNPLYFWTIDGWDVELMFQHTDINKKTGHRVTTFTNRPTVVIVLDPFNNYPIGYAVGDHENPQLIQMALRNAALHTAALFGNMYRAHQIQSDRYAISKMSPYYDVVADKNTPARAKNAKAKVIEPYFKSLNKNYCQIKLNWSGFGITSKKDSQPNNEFLNKYKHEFPDWDGVVKQVSEIVEAERASKYEAYMAQWDKLGDEDKLPMGIETFLLAFGQRHTHKNMMQDNGMKVTINGIKHDYDCFDLNFRLHNSTQWTIIYNPEDLTKVLAVNDDETLRFLLEEKYVQPMALKDRKPGDSGQLVRVNNFNKEVRAYVIDERAKNIENMATVFTMINSHETLKKLMITDSSGQHKDRRNANRLKHKEVVKRSFKSLAEDLRQEPESESQFDMY